MPVSKNILVAGIGTEVGKTVASAILVKMLKADYWKPISCGSDEERDSIQVKKWVADPNICFHPEAYHFQAPLSPHHAADLEDIEPSFDEIIPPKTENRLVIESVGGILVPVNNSQHSLDLFKQWDCSWIVVARNYLGSINHTLLTLKVLKDSGINVIGLIFNGEENSHTEKFILDHTRIPMIGRIQQEKEINLEIIERYSERWKTHPFWKEQSLFFNKIKKTSGTPTLKL